MNKLSLEKIETFIEEFDKGMTEVQKKQASEAAVAKSNKEALQADAKEVAEKQSAQDEMIEKGTKDTAPEMGDGDIGDIFESHIPRGLLNTYNK